ncbi:alpha/beta fold hydrolase [Alphaproteobacteria bacterium LSUCC0684]
MPKTETITFMNREGVPLAARLDYALGAHRGWAVFAHCFTCSKDSLAAARVAQYLAMEGIGVLRLDFTGLGQSEGSFEDTGFTANIDDIVAAAAWLEDNYAAPDLLIGHSLGGAAVLAAAASVPSVRGVATIGAPADPAHVRHLFADAIPAIEAIGIAEVVIGGRPIRIGKSFVDDLLAQDAPAVLARLQADLLVMHAPEDEIVKIDNATRIFAAARHPKSFVSLDTADHLLTRKKDSAFAAKVIAAWASRCLGDELGGDEAGRAGSDPEAVLVRSSPDGIFAHDISIGTHRLRVDEPARITGGLDSGPAPYDFLKAGLGACTAITIRLVAQRKGWPLENCEVEVLHRKEGEGKEKKDIFSRRLVLEGALDESQRDYLFDIANKCPVHRTLEAEADIETELQ